MMEVRHSRYFTLLKESPELFEDSGNLHIDTDIKNILEFEKETGLEIGVIYASRFNRFVVDLVYTDEGKRFTYERLIPAVTKGAVVTIPVLNDKYILLRQYRHAMRDFQYAFPRGYGEPGIDGKNNALKELSEEIKGYVKEVKHIGNVVADSGISGNLVEVYECIMEQYDTSIGHEEIVGSVELTGEKIRQWIQTGKINDGFTLAALQLLNAQEKL